MLDTIAALVEIADAGALSPEMFQGGTTTEVFTDGDADNAVTVRLWRNPQDGEPYLPRITWWPGEQSGGWLKAEFSIPKMVARRPGEKKGTGHDLLLDVTPSEVQLALDRVDNFLAQEFGNLPPIRTWMAQRVDYTVNWQVGSLLPVYMSALQKLRISSWSRHPYDASEGVVWKSRSTRGRWVKFYNKTKELKSTPHVTDYKGDPPIVLRFEVSNYKDAVRYMSDKWFDCGRQVGELVHPGRALYGLARQWERLGLRSGEFGRDERLLFDLTKAMGTRSVAAAHYVLTLWRQFGDEAYKELELVKRSTYYYQVNKLRKAGFLVSVGDSEELHTEALPSLHLPAEAAFIHLLSNLELSPGEGVYASDPSNSLEKFSWCDLVQLLGLAEGAPESPYIMDRWRAYVASLGGQGTPAPVDAIGGTA